MIPLSQLWVPILLAAVIVHLAGFVMWMVMPHHRNDWSKLPNEDGILNALRSAGVGGGQYNFPHPPSREAMKDPAFAISREMFNGIVFGLLTAGVFGWLWPQ